MPTYGNNSISSNNYWYAYGLNTNNQIAAKIVMPENGVINGVGAYFGGDGVTLPNCRLCLWDNSGNLLRQSSSFSQPSGTRTSQGQSWAYLSISDYSANSGDNFYIGYYRDPTVWHVYGLNISTGTHYLKTNTGSSPGSLSGFSSQGGTIGAYIGYYIPGSGTDGDPNPPPPPQGGVKIWNGSSFIKHPVKVWNGSSWIWRPVKTWNGSSWIRRA